MFVLVLFSVFLNPEGVLVSIILEAILKQLFQQSAVALVVASCVFVLGAREPDTVAEPTFDGLLLFGDDLILKVLNHWIVVSKVGFS